MNLSKRAWQHRESIVESFGELAREKYDRGHREHNGDLLTKSTLDLLYEIRDEAIDTFIYAERAIEKELDNLARLPLD